MEKKKTHKLAGNFEESFLLLAISCPENQIKTAWNINKNLDINLRDYSRPVESINPINSYPVFSDIQSIDDLCIHLIRNKLAESILVRELPNIDYILEIKGSISKFDKDEFIRKMKKVQGITAVIEIVPEKIKRKTPFVNT